MKNFKSFQTVFLILLLNFIIFGTAAAEKQLENPVRFAILGDRTGGHIPGLFGKSVEQIQRLRPDFVMTVGDMIEGYYDDSVRIAEEWAEYDSIIAPLTMPIYHTPGNHDIWSDYSEKMYRLYKGKPYYSFDTAGVHFAILDNGRWSSVSEFPSEQIEWLTEDLKANQDAAYTMVFMHKPFWFGGVDESQPDTLHSLFVNHGVDAVFTGHFHDYFAAKYDGILYTGIGSSGARTDKAPTGLGHHTGWVTVDNDGIHIVPIDLGAVRAWDDVTTGEMRAFDPLARMGISFVEPVVVHDESGVPASKVRVVLHNEYSPYESADTIRWEMTEGWTIEPSELAYNIPPKVNDTLYFEVAAEENVFPVPTINATFTYAENKRVKSENFLRVARTAECPEVSGKVKVDGRLKEDVWKEPETALYDRDGQVTEMEPVEFYFAHDDENLYIAAKCTESQMDKLAAKATEHDGSVYGEDCVGFFLAPRPDVDTLYQIYFNPLGTVYDVKYWIKPDTYPGGTIDWNVEAETATDRGNDFWSIEIKMPLAQFGLTGEDVDRMKINFRRKQKRLAAAADWQVPLEYDVSSFGYLVFR